MSVAQNIPPNSKANRSCRWKAGALFPAFANRPIERDAIFWEHEGNAAVRAGDWKLVRLGLTGSWELYDLKTDRSELHDLAAAQPAKVKELATKWEAWAERAHVKPYPGKGGGKKKANGKRQAEPDNE